MNTVFESDEVKQKSPQIEFPTDDFFSSSPIMTVFFLQFDFGRHIIIHTIIRNTFSKSLSHAPSLEHHYPTYLFRVS